MRIYRKRQFLWLAWICFVAFVYLALYPKIFKTITSNQNSRKTTLQLKFASTPFVSWTPSGPEHSLSPWVYKLLNDLVKALPTGIEPIIIDLDLFKCLKFRSNCYEMQNKTLLRLALFTRDWTQIKELQIGEVQLKHENTLMLKFHKMEVFLSEMVPQGNYLFVPGDESFKIPDLRFLISPLRKLRLFGCCTVLLFENANLYLRQLSYSQFIPCQAELAAKLRNDNPEMYLAQNRAIKGNPVDAMAKLRDAFYKINVHPFLFGGTLLGWYRECDIIPHTGDIDFGVFSTEITQQTAEQLVNIHGNCTLDEEQGHINLTDQYLYEMRFTCDGIDVDVFAIYSDHVSSWSGLWASDKIYRSVVPLINNLCTSDLLGELFFVPCQVEPLLEKEYGRKWRSIVHNDNYGYSNLELVGPRKYITAVFT